MRKYLLLFILLSYLPVATRGQTQPDLSGFPHPTQAKALRYWFDDDASNMMTVDGLSGTYSLDASALKEGVHTLHYQVVDSEDHVAYISSCTFLKTQPLSSSTMQLLRYWFDDDDNSLQTTNATDFMTLDVSTLNDGLHTIHYQTIGSDGQVYHVASSIFLKTAEIEEAHKLMYWFDDDTTTLKETDAASGLQTLDVSNRLTGLHTVHYQLKNKDGQVGVPVTAMFMKMIEDSKARVAKYQYWVNENNQTLQTVKVENADNPYTLISQLPMPKEPIQTSRFHFEVTGDVPTIYAKNVFHIRFYDMQSCLVEGERTFVDTQMSETVKPVGRLKETQTFDRVEENGIRWYNVKAAEGDTIAFKIDDTCTMQLFSASGEELYSASDTLSTTYHGCRVQENGMYYLAVHDVTGNQSEMTLDYLHRDKDGNEVVDDQPGDATSLVATYEVTIPLDYLYSHHILLPMDMDAVKERLKGAEEFNVFAPSEDGGWTNDYTLTPNPGFWLTADGTVCMHDAEDGGLSTIGYAFVDDHLEIYQHPGRTHHGDTYTLDCCFMDDAMENKAIVRTIVHIDNPLDNINEVMSIERTERVSVDTRDAEDEYYPFVALDALDMDAIKAAIGTETPVVFGKRPDGLLTNGYTLSGVGFWFDAEGNVCGFYEDCCKIGYQFVDDHFEVYQRHPRTSVNDTYTLDCYFVNLETEDVVRVTTEITIVPHEVNLVATYEVTIPIDEDYTPAVLPSIDMDAVKEGLGGEDYSLVCAPMDNGNWMDYYTLNPASGFWLTADGTICSWEDDQCTIGYAFVEDHLEVYQRPSRTKVGDTYTLYCCFMDESKENGALVKTIVTITDKQNDVLPGDANGDGAVDITDVVCIVNYILGKSSTNFVFEAADVKGDGFVDITDVVCVVNIILGKGNQAKARDMEVLSNALTMLSEKDGINILVEGAAQFAAMQFDVTVSDDATLLDATLNSKPGHQVGWTKIGTNRYRVLAYSLNNANFEPTEDALMKLVLSDGATASIEKATFVTADRRSIAMNIANEATGIELVDSSKWAVDKGVIYNLAGQRMGISTQSLPAGIYIRNGKKIKVK